MASLSGYPGIQHSIMYAYHQFWLNILNILNILYIFNVWNILNILKTFGNFQEWEVRGHYGHLRRGLPSKTCRDQEVKTHLLICFKMSRGENGSIHLIEYSIYSLNNKTWTILAGDGNLNRELLNGGMINIKSKYQQQKWNFEGRATSHLNPY